MARRPKKPLAPRRNPVAKAVTRLKPKVVRSLRVYSRKQKRGTVED